MKRIKTTSIVSKRRKDSRIYKVRVAMTLAHYILVDAKNDRDAENKVASYVDSLNKDGFASWYSESSHINTYYEAEEAE